MKQSLLNCPIGKIFKFLSYIVITALEYHLFSFLINTIYLLVLCLYFSFIPISPPQI